MLESSGFLLAFLGLGTADTTRDSYYELTAVFLGLSFWSSRLALLASSLSLF